ncbi:MAG: Smr/MutS family protein [Pseudomonadota bacterium]
MVKKTPLSDTDKALFRHAMRDVQPLDKKLKQEKTYPPSPPSPVKRSTVFNSVTDKMDSFIALSDKEDTLIHADTFLQFRQAAISMRDFKKLKQGQKAFAATLDLHGYTIEEARQNLINFLANARKQNHQIIQIIHGKGSRSGSPILKSKVYHWLKQIDFILAFCSCLPKHGGAGAIYVWLKKAT